MTVTVNLRFPTYIDAMKDCDRVLDLVRQSVIGKSYVPSVTVYEREEKFGGGFGWFFTCGPISFSCRAMTRYSVRYHTPTVNGGDHGDDFEAVTAEQALEDCRAFLEARIEHARLALAILSGPAS